MPDSKIKLFWLLFPTLALFWAPNHDSSPITINILAIHLIAKYNLFCYSACPALRKWRKIGLISHLACAVAEENVIGDKMDR